MIASEIYTHKDMYEEEDDSTGADFLCEITRDARDVKDI